MNSRIKSIAENTYIPTKIQQSSQQFHEDQDDRDQAISEKDEYLEDLSCSQFIKKTEFSLNKEDMQSTSRFDSEYINNALHEGLNNCLNNNKGIPTEEELEEYEQIQMCQKSNIRDERQNEQEYCFNYTPYSSFNRQIGQNTNQGIISNEKDSFYMSLLNKQREEIQLENKYMNEIQQLKYQNYALEQENSRLKEENNYLKQQNLTKQDLLRMQAEYTQIKHDEKINQALQNQKDQYEGKLTNYKQQIQMYQTTIDNIRSQYKDKNEKLQEMVLKLEKEKQELIDKSIQQLKDKIQNKLIEENNLNTQLNVYSSTKQKQNTNNSSCFNSNLQLNSTINQANESFENLNNTGSFSKNLLSNKSNDKSFDRFQDFRVDQIQIQNKNDYSQLQNGKDHQISFRNPIINIQSQLNQQSTKDIRKEQPLDQINQYKSNNNQFQLTKTQKQQDQYEEYASNVSNREQQIKFYDQHEEIYQQQIQKSLLLGQNLLQNNNASRKSELQSPHSNQLQFYNNNYEKRSYSFDSNALKEIKKDQQSLKNNLREDIAQLETSLERDYKQQEKLLTDNESMRKKSMIQYQSRKNSINEGIENQTTRQSSNQNTIRNNFSNTLDTIFQAPQNKKTKLKSSSQQRNNSSFTNSYTSLNKENIQTSINTNKTAYMKQTQSSKQKNSLNKTVDNQQVQNQITKSNNGNGSDKKVNKKQVQTQQKKQFPIYSRVKNLNNL